VGVKNLTYTENVTQIYQNHLDGCNYTHMSSYNPFLTGPELSTLFRGVRTEVGEQLETIRVYGLTSPIAFVYSDNNDCRRTVSVQGQLFDTIDDIRDYLVQELLSDNEVYIYTVDSIRVFSPEFREVRKFSIRCSSFHRSRWVGTNKEPMIRPLHKLKKHNFN